MQNTVIMTILCILAVYGLIRLIFSIALMLMENPDGTQIHTVAMFKNNEEDAEGQIRSLIWERAISGAESTGDIIAVDLGSVDDTLPILRRLEDEYETLCVMEKWEYEEYINKRI